MWQQFTYGDYKHRLQIINIGRGYLTVYTSKYPLKQSSTKCSGWSQVSDCDGFVSFKIDEILEINGYKL